MKNTICLEDWIKLVIFLGPVGAMVPLPGLPASFRVYYFLLVITPLLFLSKKNSKLQLKSLAVVVLFCLFSLSTILFNSEIDAGNLTKLIAFNPLLRLGLFSSLALFSLYAATLYLEKSSEERIQLLRIFLWGFLFSLAWGYFSFAGFYLGIVPLKLLELTQVQVQFGFGILRFSPGSYANEYGTVASFSACILIFSYFSGKSNFIVGNKLTLWVMLLFVFVLNAYKK